MAKTVTCTYHCSNCDSHFSSLVAFDFHRRGDYSGPDSRYCEEPMDLPRLVALSERGRCDLQRPLRTSPVAVWTMRAGLATARTHFASLRSTASPEMERVA